jgi:ankyrin repeat protein
VNPNVSDYDGRRALHIAACEGHSGLVQYLLRVGATVIDAVDRFGGNPIRDASVNGHEDIARMIERAE